MHAHFALGLALGVLAGAAATTSAVPSARRRAFFVHAASPCPARPVPVSAEPFRIAARCSPAAAQRQRVSWRQPARTSALSTANGEERAGSDNAASEASSAGRFDDWFERSQNKVDTIEQTEALAKLGFDIDGAVLRNQSGERVDPETLRGTSVALLFSAGWCPDCTEFLPLLRSFYEMQNAPAPQREAPGSDGRSKVSIVYVSSDRSSEDAAACFRETHGDWLTLDFDSPLRQEYKQRHGIWAGSESSIFATSIDAFQSRRGGIPALAVLTPEGLMANYLDAEALGLECLLRWSPEDYKWSD